MDEKEPILKSTKEKMQEELTSLGEEPTAEQLKKTVLYLCKVFESTYATVERDRTTLLRALERSQIENDKMYAALHKTRWAKFTTFWKKVFIAKGWYEISTEELTLIHDENFGART